MAAAMSVPPASINVECRVKVCTGGEQSELLAVAIPDGPHYVSVNAPTIFSASHARSLSVELERASNLINLAACQNERAGVPPKQVGVPHVRV